MKTTSPALVAAILAGTIVSLLSAAVCAQDKPIEFRLAAAKGNSSACVNLDAALSRVHTITLMGDTAVIKSAGGVNDKMKQTSTNVYKTTFAMGGPKLDVAADASKTPRTLDVTEPALGCRWSAIAP
jgi:hypothetical protein